MSKQTKELFVTVRLLEAYKKESLSNQTSILLEARDHYSSLSQRCDQIEAKFDTRCDQIEAKFDARCDQLEAKFDARCDQLEAKIDKLDRKIDLNFSKMMDVLCRMEVRLEEHSLQIKYLFDSNQQLWRRIDELEEKKLDKDKYLPL